MNSPPDYEWEQLLDIDDSDLSLTLRKSRLGQYPVPAGIVQATKLRKQSDIHEGRDEFVLSAQEYIRKVVGDEDFKVGSWVSMVEFVNANGGGIVNGCLGDIKNYLKNRKLEQVVAIIKSCTPNSLGDLTVTLKDLSGTIPGTIHYKFVNEEGYGKDINVGSVLILANVLVFSPKPSMHYLNITMRNVVKIFRKVTVPKSESGSAENLYAIAAENLYAMAITEKEKKKKFKVIAVRDKEAEKLNVYGFTKTFLREVKKEISKKFQ
ncbi:hypothetical protein Tco_1159811 [Tanacetum coccineum]